MAKAIFFNVPASGHINPSLPLVAELVRRGDHVIYYLSEGYRRKVEATGAEFRPYATISDTYFEERGLDGSNPPLTARRMIETTQAILPQLVEIARAEQPDYILYDSMCPWGALVARVLNVPSVSSQGLLSVTPAMLMQPAMLRTIVPVLARGLPHTLAYLRTSQAVAKQHNIKPLRLMDVFNAPADVTICYTSAAFQPGGDKLSQQITFVGPAIEPRLGDDDFPYHQLDSRPLIYISLGTVINDNAAFYRNCIAAFRDSACQVVMSIGQKVQAESLGPIPSNFIVRGFVPQLKILERAALFITHAGMNSVHEGLYFDVPLLLVPQHDEQTITAQRVEQLGAGLVIKEKTPEAALLSMKAERLLNDSAFRRNAVEIGQTLRQAGGMSRAADTIHALVRRQAAALQ